ncbi:acyl-CoA dehydrogenase family protein [Pseudomonas sp. DR48]|uniref:acyl-CoA dehydrogenase family protein n=1 Tax=Pseudomonas sp. DR48 TaxID=2871095 RepID=UPI001C98FD70|nr:acyl-CoA dehydrogenase family protein [Pseudomonas sp. DR48]QZP31498.1 acyl-CoA dehydrogenase family protein [Pseudomonas sp. DR48]
MNSIIRNANIDAQSDSSDLVAAASGLVETLRLRTREVDELARLPESTVAELDAIGAFDLMIPHQYGGLQTSIRTYMEVISEIGRGDASAGWTCALINICNWMLAALYPKAVSDPIFASGGKVRSSGVLSPRKAKVKRQPGGILIEEGLWGFNSGVYHAQWDLLGIPIVNEQGETVDQGLALVSTQDITLLHDWDTMALRGSGSTSVSVKNLFVPNERIASVSKAIAGEYASTHLQGEALYRGAFIPLLAIILVFPALGIAKAALETFLAKLPGRGIQYTWYNQQDEAAVTHLQVGEASAKLDAARLVVERCVDEIDACAASGSVMDRKTRARIRRDTGYASQLIWEGVDLLATASGGSLAGSSNSFNRLWRDARVANLHGVVCTSTNLELFGRILCGKEANTPLV